MSPLSDRPPESPAVLEARDWVLRLASGTMDAPEMDAFEQWLALPGHRHAFEHERLLWRSLGARPNTGVTVQPARPRLPRRRQVALAMVAVLACVLFLPTLALHLRADHLSSDGIAQVRLPDGSIAVLDADSAIAVDYGEHRRQIALLRGRAWFEVAHSPDVPFRVTVGDGVVEDISTAFMVSRAGDRVEAAVEQGQVRVSARPEQGWMYLRAGQAAGWHKGGIAVRGADVALDHVAAWRRGELLLEDAPVAQVLAELGRYRPGRIFIRGDLSALPHINTALRLDRPEQALDTLAAGSGLSVTRLPLGIAIVQPARVDAMSSQ